MPKHCIPSVLKEFRSLLHDAAPIWAFYATEILVGLTDLAVVGALGTDALAAVGLGKTILLSVLTVGFAVLSVGTVLMAENPSQKRCGAVLAGSFFVAIVFSGLVVAIAGTAPPLLAVTGYDEELIRHFSEYTAVLALAAGPAMVFSALKNVLVVHGRTAVIFWLSLGIVAANLAGSVVLVHGLGDWQGIGVSGAAWATFGVNMCAAAVLFSRTLWWRLLRLTAISIRSAFACSREIISLGWAAGAQQLLESLLFVAVLYLLGLYSPVWLAAGSIAFAVMELNYAASASLGEVLAARLAVARSSGDRPRLMLLMRLGPAMASIGAIALAVVVLFFPAAIVSVFSSPMTQPDAQRLMGAVLQWTAPFFVFDALQVVFIHALRGLRRVVGPMLISSGSYWAVGVGCGVLFAETFAFGAVGIWAGFCLGLVCAALILGLSAFRAANNNDHVRA